MGLLMMPVCLAFWSMQDPAVRCCLGVYGLELVSTLRLAACPGVRLPRELQLTLMSKPPIRVSEAEAANDFRSLPARVRDGAEVVIERNAETVAVLRPPEQDTLQQRLIGAEREPHDRGKSRCQDAERTQNRDARGKRNKPLEKQHREAGDSASRTSSIRVVCLVFRTAGTPRCSMVSGRSWTECGLKFHPPRPASDAMLARAERGRAATSS